MEPVTVSTSPSGTTIVDFGRNGVGGPSDALTAVVVHSDMTRTDWSETSDELINRLHANTVWSMRDNFVGVPTDCPQRDERMGWTGDINSFAPPRPLRPRLGHRLTAPHRGRSVTR
ncbi:hypothetical protein ACIBO4_04370 [Streptomyces sp. NPDC050149]|uniref:alpha-L-rhamnosidase-related protein n=1 Tax=Streptomyces sp. NPDC050149 TaxID=3365603 RepID=UPI00379D271C